MSDMWENGTGTTASIDTRPGIGGSMNTTIPFYIVGFILNVFGNTAIIVAIAKFPWLKHNMYVALQTLAVSDLLVTWPIVIECIRQYDYTVITGITWPILNQVQIFLILGACYHVVLVAMDRFVAIMFPFQYNAYVTPKLIRICSIFTYLFALVLSIPNFIMNFAGIMKISISALGLYIVGSFSNIFGYTLLAFLLVFFNVKVTLAAKQQRQRVEVNNKNQAKKPGVNRATKMMVIVVGVYLLLWAPFTASNIASLTLQRSTAVIEFISTFGLLLGMYNSSVNFILYTAFNTKLRMSFRKLFRLGTDIQTEESTTPT